MVHPDCPLIDILSTFQLGRAHLALVSSQPEEALRLMTEGKPLVGAGVAPVGIITLEDVMVNDGLTIPFLLSLCA